MNGRAEVPFTHSILGGHGIKHELATRGTPEKHSHYVGTLMERTSCWLKISLFLVKKGVCEFLRF